MPAPKFETRQRFYGSLEEWRCTCCERWRPVAAFSRSGDRVASWCDNCARVMMKIRREREAFAAGERSLYPGGMHLVPGEFDPGKPAVYQYVDGPTG